MNEAVIVSTARTPIGKAFRGAFNDTEAPTLGGHVVAEAVRRAGIAPDEVDDVIIGAAAQQGTQAYNLGRLCATAAGLPVQVSGMAVERQCASGLMSIAIAAKGILCNELDIAVAGGLESISWCRTSTRTSTAGSPPWCVNATRGPTSRCSRPAKSSPSATASPVKNKMPTAYRANCAPPARNRAGASTLNWRR